MTCKKNENPTNNTHTRTQLLTNRVILSYSCFNTQKLIMEFVFSRGISDLLQNITV